MFLPLTTSANHNGWILPTCEKEEIYTWNRLYFLCEQMQIVRKGICRDGHSTWAVGIARWPRKVKNGHDAKEDGTVLPVNQRRRALVALRTAGRSCACCGSKLGCFTSVSAARYIYILKLEIWFVGAMKRQNMGRSGSNWKPRTLKQCQNKLKMKKKRNTRVLCGIL